MEENVGKVIAGLDSFEAIAKFEANARRLNRFDDEVVSALRKRANELGRVLVAARTGLDLSELSPAQEKIVQAAAEYAAIKRRGGSNTQRMFNQLKNRGLIESVEYSVAKAKPTEGFQTLSDENRADLSYERIVLDHPEEFSPRALWYARRALKLTNDTVKPPSRSGKAGQQKIEKNKPWSRDELILALDLYLRSRISPFAKGSDEVVELSNLLNVLGKSEVGSAIETYRNPNGVYMKMMNFRRFDPQYTSDGKVGLTRGNKLEEVVWKEFADDAVLRAIAVKAIKAGFQPPEPADQPYWVFVCNPKKWAVDRFFDRNIELDSWGVRPADKDKFAPGQLGIVRVGVDKRNAAERGGRPPLEPGIYAICEVVSSWFPGTGANDEFWNEGEGREPGWPTVRIRYLHIYREKPLTIETLRALHPELSPLVLNGFQAASFPIGSGDFREVTRLLNFDLDDMPALIEGADPSADKLAALEAQFLRASPEVKERVSRTVERGPVGRALKKALGYKCQLCYAMGNHSIGFTKKNGDPYVEAHHVMPVAALQVGSLAASNVMILCANHHRQIHYGNAQVTISGESFDLRLDGKEFKIPRPAVGNSDV